MATPSPPSDQQRTRNPPQLPGTVSFQRVSIPIGVAGRDDDDPIPRRVPTACVRCRARKIKCDGAQPACVHCSKNGQSCQYLAVTAAENQAARAKKNLSTSDRNKSAPLNRGTRPRTKANSSEREDSPLGAPLNPSYAIPIGRPHSRQWDPSHGAHGGQMSMPPRASPSPPLRSGSPSAYAPHPYPQHRHHPYGSYNSRGFPPPPPSFPSSDSRGSPAPPSHWLPPQNRPSFPVADDRHRMHDPPPPPHSIIIPTRTGSPHSYSSSNPHSPSTFPPSLTRTYTGPSPISTSYPPRPFLSSYSSSSSISSTTSFARQAAPETTTSNVRAESPRPALPAANRPSPTTTGYRTLVPLEELERPKGFGWQKAGIDWITGGDEKKKGATESNDATDVFAHSVDKVNGNGSTGSGGGRGSPVVEQKAMEVDELADENDWEKWQKA